MNNKKVVLPPKPGWFISDPQGQCAQAYYKRDIDPHTDALNARISSLEDQVGAMRKAIEAAIALHDDGHALSRFNWGASFLRAQDIRELNELPGVLRAALLTDQPVEEVTTNG